MSDNPLWILNTSNKEQLCIIAMFYAEGYRLENSIDYLNI